MINLAQVLGRVGKIDTRTMQSGLKVTNLSMVTTKKITKDGTKEEKATWHNISLFSKLSEIAERYVAVGDLLYVQGEMESKKYEGQDGVERTKFYIIGHELKLMPRTKEHQAKAAPSSDFAGQFPNDDVPF